jgi:hypothetical protein
MASRTDGPESSEPEQQPASPSFHEAFAAAAQRSSLGQVRPGETPTGGALLGAVGGIRGLIETILPGLGFLVVYTITREVLPSVLAPLALSAIFIVVRVVTRSPVTPAISGAVGIGISAAFALFTGNAADNFLPGFVINTVTSLAMIISLIARRPLVGVIVGLLTGDPHWRLDRAKLRIAFVTTVLWLGLSVARLAVQVPLYLAAQGDDPAATQALAATKLIMGVPLYAGLLWVTWLLVRTAWRPAEEIVGDAADDTADGESTSST